jgi:hypothetical protein
MRRKTQRHDGENRLFYIEYGAGGSKQINLESELPVLASGYSTVALFVLIATPTTARR